MSNDKIMTMLNEKSQPEYYRFVAEDDEKCCDDCKKHNDKIFQENDPDIPKLPIHPNCRCKYEPLTQEEVISYQEDVQKIKTQLINYGNQIAAKATQLLTECEKEVKTQTVIHTANAVMTALPIISKTMEVVKKGKALEE